jgi:hypothetical protein
LLCLVGVVNPQGVEAFPLVGFAPRPAPAVLLLGLSRFRWVFGAVLEALPPSGECKPDKLINGGG